MPFLPPRFLETFNATTCTFCPTCRSAHFNLSFDKIALHVVCFVYFRKFQTTGLARSISFLIRRLTGILISLYWQKIILYFSEVYVVMTVVFFYQLVRCVPSWSNHWTVWYRYLYKALCLLAKNHSSNNSGKEMSSKAVFSLAWFWHTRERLSMNLAWYIFSLIVKTAVNNNVYLINVCRLKKDQILHSIAVYSLIKLCNMQLRYYRKRHENVYNKCPCVFWGVGLYEQDYC